MQGMILTKNACFFLSHSLSLCNIAGGIGGISLYYSIHDPPQLAVVKYRLGWLSGDPGCIKQTFETRRWGRVGETGGPAHSTGGPAHSEGVAIWRSSNA